LYNFLKLAANSGSAQAFSPSLNHQAEIDVTCYLCGGKGCNVCKKSGHGLWYGSPQRAAQLRHRAYASYCKDFYIRTKSSRPITQGVPF